MRRKSAAGPKLKQVVLKFINEKKNPAIYELIDSVRKEAHGELETAKIAAFWIQVAKPDLNGNVPTGKAKLASGSVRATAGYDLEIHLNQREWELRRADDAWRKAEIDRLLCFFAVALDKDGGDKRDDEGRKVFRFVRPDVVAHRAHLRRHKPDDITMIGLRAALECEETHQDLFSSLKVKPENVTAIPNRRGKQEPQAAAAV